MVARELPVVIKFLLFFWAAACCFAVPLSPCRSNATHSVWTNKPFRSSKEWEKEQRRVGEESYSKDDGDNNCWVQTREEAQKDALNFLREHVMPFDVPNMESLGLGSSSSKDIDGLDTGIAQPSIELAFQAKEKFAWADGLPQEIFYEYVVSFVHVNEPRTNWRPLFWDALTNTILPSNDQENPTIQEIVKLINFKVWFSFANLHDRIVFKSGQTPLIFDPMSILVYGYASCTGFSIFLVSALRTAGIPARVVGTPAWNQNYDHGNHNWIEVWVDGEWIFMEPTSANQEKFVDNLDKDPCKRWFCHPKRFINGTQVWAARLVDETGESYPMAWELDSTDVPGEDRTEYYQNLCNQC